ncbi:MAG: sigma-70 family RNA polymerase sigma factor [Chloroflexota bacterium]|nr:sigma-70 family RNA polymerase sigma factor [Chloroflexota bacterium]
MTDYLSPEPCPTPGHPTDLASAFVIWWHRLVRHAAMRLGSTAEAEDAVSSAFMHAYEHRHRYDKDRATLGTWLTTIVRNEVTGRLRKRANEGRVVGDVAEASASSDDLEALILAREQAERLARNIARLPSRDQLIITLRFERGLTNRQIARELDGNERTVSVWLLRALRRLKELMEEDGDDHC